MTHSFKPRRTHWHICACAHSRTHARIYINLYQRTRAHIVGHARARFGREGWARAALLKRGSPHQSAPGPLSLHWRAGGTRAPGRSGNSETEQRDRGSRDGAAAAE